MTAPLRCFRNAVARHGLGQQEQARDIQGDHLVPAVKGIVFGARTPGRAGVVDEDIDPAKPCDDALGQAGRGVRRAEVGNEANGRAVRPARVGRLRRQDPPACELRARATRRIHRARSRSAGPSPRDPPVMIATRPVRSNKPLSVPPGCIVANSPMPRVRRADASCRSFRSSRAAWRRRARSRRAATSWRPAVEARRARLHP